MAFCETKGKIFWLRFYNKGKAVNAEILHFVQSDKENIKNCRVVKAETLRLEWPTKRFCC